MFDKEEKVKAVYKDNQLEEVYIKFKKETPSGYTWDEIKLSDVVEIIEVKKDDDYQDKPTVDIRVYGKFEEVFQQ